MKLWRINIALFILFLLTFCGGAGWLLFSEAGSSWLLTQVAVATDSQLGSVKGTLIGNLRLHEWKSGSPEMTLSCGTVELDSSLTGIFPLRLKINQLKINQLKIHKLSLTSQQSAPVQSPPKLSWPDLPWWLGLLEIDLQKLVMEEIHLQQEDSEKQIEQLRGRGQWTHQQLQFTSLEIRTPDLTFSGSFNAFFDTAAVQIDLQVDNRLTGQHWQRLQLHGALQAADNLLLSGPVWASFDDTTGPWLSADGKLSLSSDEFLFEGFQLKSSRRNGNLQFSGKMNFAASEAKLSCRLQLHEVDLQPEAGQQFQLSGSIDLNGALDKYQGRFTLASQAKPPFAMQLSGIFSGNQHQLLLNELSGEWLHGQLRGQLQADWLQGWKIKSQITGHQLDPRQINDQLQGALNFALDADLNDKGKGLDGGLIITLEDAVFQQQPLTGHLALAINQSQLEIAALDLQGIGFKLRGHGTLTENIYLTWQVDQLEKLLPDCRGQLRGAGRLQLAPTGINADMANHGERLQYHNLTLDKWLLKGELDRSRQFKLEFSGHDLKDSHSEMSFKRFQITTTGNDLQHSVAFRFGQSGSNLNGRLEGGWKGRQWQGYLAQLRIEDKRIGLWQISAPASLLLSKQQLQLGQMQLANTLNGSITVQGNYLPLENQAEVLANWHRFDLSLFNPWLTNVNITGTSSGNVSLQQQGKPHLHGQISWQGEIKAPHQTLSFTQADWRWNWGKQGLKSRFDLLLADGGQLQLELDNDEPFSVHWPSQLHLQLHGKNVPLQRIQPWLPPGFSLAGKLRVQTDGFWYRDRPWQLSGLAEITKGKFSWQEDEDLISNELSIALLHWTWHEQLAGQLELKIEERGHVDADITLPIPARWPVSVQPGQTMDGVLSGQLQELGLVSVLFPERVQESSGQLKVDLQLGGIWQKPQLRGNVRLFDGKVFLPKQGIQLKEIKLYGNFDEQHISLNTLQVRSGDGFLSGTGEAHWQPQHYHLTLNGSDFQLLNQPSLQANISPELTVDGDLKQVNIKGIINIPRLLASGKQKTSLAENSPDLVVVDAPQKISKPLRIQPNIDLKLLLGESILIKTAGIDARVEGNFRLKSTPQQALAAFGEIHVAEGRYASYGINLDISRGNLIFNGGPISQPLLDILALRTAGEVKAGVQVTGTPKRPIVKLFSEPSLPETDILSYIVLGRPVNIQGSQSSVLMTAAGALLSQGESVVLQEKLKSSLGLDVIDINAGDGDAKSSVITAGKYLNPGLYVSFGYSLFNNSNEIKLRYTLSPRWEVESNFGSESGADLFYKIDIP